MDKTPRPEIALLLELVLDLKKDQSELKDMMQKNAIILERNTITVEQHENRSTNLEGRMERLENRDQMLNGFVKISLGLLGVAGTIAAIVAGLQAVL